MTDPLLSKIKKLKEKEDELSKELENIKKQKEKEQEEVEKELSETLKELLIEEKKRFEESKKKEVIDDFINQEQVNMPQINESQSLDDSLYESLKTVTEKPYNLWSNNEKEFVSNVSYQIDKLKDSYSQTIQDVVGRTENLLKKDEDKKYIV